MPIICAVAVGDAELQACCAAGKQRRAGRTRCPLSAIQGERDPATSASAATTRPSPSCAPSTVRKSSPRITANQEKMWPQNFIICYYVVMWAPEHAPTLRMAFGV